MCGIMNISKRNTLNGRLGLLYFELDDSLFTN